MGNPICNKIMRTAPCYYKNKCIGCGKCAEICPQKVITIKNKKASIKKDKCIKCFCCHEMCPAKAIKVSRFKIFDIKF
ncbi:MAG: 4Fe-4S binding protein [Oscillospiraceae bacterium]